MEEEKKVISIGSNECFSNRFWEDIKEKDFCCVYVYTGRREHGVVRYIINNGKADIHKWIVSEEEKQVNDNSEEIMKTLVSLLGNEDIDFKFIESEKFPGYIWKDVRFDQASMESDDSPVLSFYGVFLVKDAKKQFSFEEIETIVPFIQYSLDLASNLNKDNYNLYYRGQLAHWDLNPSLFRRKEWVEHESELNAQIICDRPNDFADCRTTFDRLVKLKHYNQPSRLLDLTSNPLVGLFFACDCMVEDKTKGCIGMVVFAFSEEVKEKKSVSSDTVTLLSALSNTKRFKGINTIPEECKGKNGKILPKEIAESECNTCELLKRWKSPEPASGTNGDDGKADKKTVDRDKFMGELIHQCKKESGSELYWTDLCYGELNQCILVWPPLNNNRIVQQQGCFIMCGADPNDLNKPPESLKSFFSCPSIKGNTGSNTNNSLKRFFILPANLEKILSELKVFGIDKYYIYPDLEKDIGERKELISTKYGEKTV